MSSKRSKASKKVTQKKSKKSQKIKRLPSFSTQQNWLTIAIIAVFTFIVLSPILNNHFTNWDDNLYVLENPLIRSLDLSTISDIFSMPSAFNYHPLTILSLNFNYQISGLSPQSYYLFNLILHLINCAMVFKLTLFYSFINNYIIIILLLYYNIIII